MPISLRKMSTKIFLDVREEDEYEEGHLAEALHIPYWNLESKIQNVVTDFSTPILCYCASGFRSRLAVSILKKMGYKNVSLHEMPSHLAEQEKIYYSRHINIPEVGEIGQAKLKKAKVAIVGAGGLGSPAAYYLAAAGVGTIGIVDFDRVELSNLQRQILHTYNRVGQLKTDSAKETLSQLNPLIQIETYPVKLTKENVQEILKPYDIILDGSDNFSTRYIINDACLALGKPNVHGSVYRFKGQVTVFCQPEGPCYRCLFGVPPPPDIAPSCTQAGVLGVLPGVIGMLQAIEAIKLILSTGETLVGRLLCFDALKMQFREIKIKKDRHCSFCYEQSSSRKVV